MWISLSIAVLMGAGTFLSLQRSLVRIIIGVSLISYAVNLLIIYAGGANWRAEPFANVSKEIAADPVPQAFVLTAIVISLATTAFMLALAALGRDDDTKVTENPNELSVLEASGSQAKLLPKNSRWRKRFENYLQTNNVTLEQPKDSSASKLEGENHV